MAGNLSTYFENAVANLLRNVAFTEFNAYVGLFTSDVDLEGGNITSECTGGSYARELCGFGAAANGVISNAGNITFTTATAAWGTATHFAVMDAVTAGNVIAHGALTAPRVIADGDTAQFNTGTLVLTIS